MKIQDKIRFMPEAKKLSQEEMASKLSMSTYGYAKIERGETKANMPKLEQIAEVLKMDLMEMELLSFGEKNVAYLVGDNNQNSNNITTHSISHWKYKNSSYLLNINQPCLATKTKKSPI